MSEVFLTKFRCFLVLHASCVGSGDTVSGTTMMMMMRKYKSFSRIVESTRLFISSSCSQPSVGSWSICHDDTPARLHSCCCAMLFREEQRVNNSCTLLPLLGCLFAVQSRGNWVIIETTTVEMTHQGRGAALKLKHEWTRSCTTSFLKYTNAIGYWLRPHERHRLDEEDRFLQLDGFATC